MPNSPIGVQVEREEGTGQELARNLLRFALCPSLGDVGAVG
jgi:hypothetical protein